MNAEVAIVLLLLRQQDLSPPPEEEVDLGEGGPHLLLARPALLQQGPKLGVAARGLPELDLKRSDIF